MEDTFLTSDLLGTVLEAMTRTPRKGHNVFVFLHPMEGSPGQSPDCLLMTYHLSLGVIEHKIFFSPNNVPHFLNLLQWTCVVFMYLYKMYVYVKRFQMHTLLNQELPFPSCRAYFSTSFLGNAWGLAVFFSSWPQLALLTALRWWLLYCLSPRPLPPPSYCLFTDEKAEAQRGESTCPRSHSNEGEGCGSNTWVHALKHSAVHLWKYNVTKLIWKYIFCDL